MDCLFEIVKLTVNFVNIVWRKVFIKHGDVNPFIREKQLRIIVVGGR